MITKDRLYPFIEIAEISGQIVMTDRTGNNYSPISKRDGRFQIDEDDIVHIYDSILRNQYNCKLSEIKDNNYVKSTGTVTLDTGASGSVDGITVDGVQIMSQSVNFDTDLDTTTGLVADNINANISLPNYTAVAVGSVITITYEGFNSTDANGFVIASTVTTITSTDVNISGGVSGFLLTRSATNTYLSVFVGV